MVYFTADLHFGHGNVIKFGNRPYSSIEEMNDALVENWNRRVKEKDDVYILGDFTMGRAAYAESYLSLLKGKKHLIRGNHDLYVDKLAFPQELYVWVKDYYRLNMEGRSIVLCHYPILEWDGFYCGNIHLHGHQHNKEAYNLCNREAGILRYDVGVDANNYAPVSFQEILDFFGLEQGNS